MALTLEDEAGIKLDPEEHPRNWPLSKKLIASILPLIGAFAVASSNSTYLASIPDVTIHFNISTTLAIAPISLTAIGFGFGPIVSGAVSEIYGRRPVYIAGLMGAIIFNAVAGSTSTFRTLMVARFFASAAGAPMLTIVIGSLNDVWDSVNERIGTLFVGLFAGTMIWGTEIGPTMGQAIYEDTGDWRWTFWLNCILLGASCVAWLCPETFAPQLARRKAKRLGSPIPNRNIYDIMKVALGRPVHMIFVEPIIFPTSFISSIVMATVFFFYVAFPVVFETVYLFTPYQVGLAFLSLFIGSVLGLIIMMQLHQRIYLVAKAKAESVGQVIQPEERLYSVMVGGILLPLSLFWFAWTIYSNIHWIVPLLACIPFGAAYFLVMLGWPQYKNDVYGAEFGASALATDNFMRYLLAAPVPLFSVQMIDRIGIHWSVSIAAFISVLLIPVPWIAYRWGPYLRHRSNYVPKDISTSTTPIANKTVGPKDEENIDVELLAVN